MDTKALHTIHTSVMLHELVAGALYPFFTKAAYSPRAIFSPLSEESLTLLQTNLADNTQHRYFLDGTLGLGGHTEALLQLSPCNTTVIALDKDIHALEKARQRLAPFGNTVHYHHTSFAQYQNVLQDENIPYLDAAFFDLGISSLQVDTPERGFSFNKNAPLDMRMDQDSPLTAKHFLARCTYEELVHILTCYGEEPCAKRIARAIITRREHSPITTTQELTELILEAYPVKWRKTARIHPATRTFQALRIAINNELQDIEILLQTILNHIRPFGTLSIITFHSLEDRIVKHAFKAASQVCSCPPHEVRCTCNRIPKAHILTKKPLLPTTEEIAKNPRSRSAKLRILQKIH